MDSFYAVYHSFCLSLSFCRVRFAFARGAVICRVFDESVAKVSAALHGRFCTAASSMLPARRIFYVAEINVISWKLYAPLQIHRVAEKNELSFEYIIFRSCEKKNYFNREKNSRILELLCAEKDFSDDFNSFQEIHFRQQRNARHLSLRPRSKCFTLFFRISRFTRNLGTEGSFVLNYTRTYLLIAPNQNARTEEAASCLLVLRSAAYC